LKGDNFRLHPLMTTPEYTKFIHQMMLMVHEVVYDSKKELIRLERQEFIEILYQFIFLRLIVEIKPDTISFTSKDSLDVGASETAIFYLFLTLLTEKKLKDENKNFFFSLAYSHALLVRERAIQPERLIRMVSAFSRFHESFEKNSKKILKQLSSLKIEKIKLS